MKKILVTAGSTIIAIDQVRVISNIFQGKTGGRIANYLSKIGCEVTLITSRKSQRKKDNLRIVRYRTYDELYQRMEEEITQGNYDIIIHSAAVSDYFVAGTYYKDENGMLVQIDSSKKISSSHPSLFLELVPTAKIIDQIRTPWGFNGKLVKFKLQVGISDDELLEIARKSRTDSKADVMVANCLEWSDKYAYIVIDGKERKITRRKLPEQLVGTLL